MLSELLRKRSSFPSPPFNVPDREPVEARMALSFPAARSISLIFVKAVPSAVPEFGPVMDTLLELELRMRRLFCEPLFLPLMLLKFL